MSTIRKKIRGWNFLKREEEPAISPAAKEDKSQRPQKSNFKVNIYRTEEDSSTTNSLKPITIEELSHKIDRGTLQNIETSLRDLKVITLDTNVGSCLQGTFVRTKTRSNTGFNSTTLLLCLILVFNIFLWTKQKEIMHCLQAHSEVLSSLSQKINFGLSEITKLKPAFALQKPALKQPKAKINHELKHRQKVSLKFKNSTLSANPKESFPTELPQIFEATPESKPESIIKAKQIKNGKKEIDFSEIKPPPSEENVYPILSEAEAQAFKQEEVQTIKPSKDIPKQAINNQEKGTYDYSQIFGSGLYKNRR